MSWAGRLERMGRLLPELTDLDKVLASTKSGDPMPLIKLAHKGLAVAHPGYADATEEFAGGVLKAGNLLIGRLTGQVIDGEVITTPPWGDFLRHYPAMPWGIICIYGDPGQGKTEWAKKSAAIWRSRNGQPVELLGFYENDRPDFGYPVDMRRLIARIRKVGRYLNQENGRQINDGLTEEDLLGKKKKSTTPERLISPAEIDQMGHRTVIIDEAGLFFSSLGASGQQDTREAAKRFADQIRHLNSRFIFIAQKQGDIPPHVRASALNIYKIASIGVIQQDFRPGQKRDTMQRWEEAITALHAVQTGTLPDELPRWMNDQQREAMRRAQAAHQWFKGPWADIRAWGYAVGPLGGHFMRTVFPFDRYDSSAAA